MNNYLIVSFYTTNYKKIAEKFLLKSLKQQILPHYIKEVPEQGSWKKNTDFKAVFINQCLNQFSQNLVFIDADATINSDPILFKELSNNKDIDFGYHNLSWETHYGRPNDKGRFEFLSGTLYFANNDKIKTMVLEWIRNTQIYAPEQKALKQAIKSSPDLNIFELPREYCYINSKPRGEVSQPLSKPIISHFQASRTEKR